jgi:hypothetical protein
VSCAAGRARPAPRAPTRPADARPVPGGAASGGAARLRGGPSGARRGAGRRPGRELQMLERRMLQQDPASTGFLLRRRRAPRGHCPHHAASPRSDRPPCLSPSPPSSGAMPTSSACARCCRAAGS